VQVHLLGNLRALLITTIHLKANTDMKLFRLFLIFFICSLEINVFSQVNIDTLTYEKVGTDAAWRSGDTWYHLRSTYRSVTHPQQGLNYIYRKNGNIYMKCTFRFNIDSNLVKYDSCTYFYESGALRDCGIYENDLRIGNWEHYDETGKLDYRQNYDSWIRTYYYPDGKRQAEGKMKEKDIRKNHWEYFDLKDHMGFWNFYFENGTCECNGQFYDSTKHDRWNYYDSNGNRIRKERYRRYVIKYDVSFLDACKW